MRERPGSIVVGVDGSADSLVAVAWAAVRAAAEHRPLTLAHAIVQGDGATGHHLPATVAAAPVGASDTAGRHLATARSVAEGVTPRLDVVELLDVTDPRSQLLELSHAADLVVVGARGGGTSRSVVLGSVTLALVRRSRSPVVVLRPDQQTTRAGVHAGVAGTSDVDPVLQLAFREAARLGEPLVVVDGIRVGDREVLSESVARLGAKHPQVPVTTRRLRGADPHRELRHLATGCALLVLGNDRGDPASTTAFGSANTTLLPLTTCPVAVVPYGG